MQAKGVLPKRWSPAEDDALLRAWVDVVERRAQSLHTAFTAVCSAASLPQERSRTSLSQRRHMFQRMYEIVRAFHKRHDHQHQYAACAGSNSTSAATAEYSSDSWFELTADEQRRWFALLSTGTYAFGEMTQEAFDRVGAIHTSQEEMGSVRRTASYTQPRKEETHAAVSEGSILPTDLGAVIARLKSEQQQQHVSYEGDCKREVDHSSAHGPRGDLKHEREAATSSKKAAAVHENDSSDGSSTDSDDEFLMMWDEEGNAAHHSSPAKRLTMKAEVELPSETDGIQFAKHQSRSCQDKNNSVDPDFLDLVSILESQSRHLSELFRQTKQRRRDESRGRQFIWRKTGVDGSENSRVLQNIALRQQELQREREQWEEDRRAMKTQLAQLRERKAVPPSPLREMSDSADVEP